MAELSWILRVQLINRSADAKWRSNSQYASRITGERFKALLQFGGSPWEVPTNRLGLRCPNVYQLFFYS